MTSAAKALKFPSVGWFEAVSDVFNQDEATRGGGGGVCNCTAGVKVGKKIFVLTFEGFECSAAEESTPTGLDDADFYLEMSAKEWREMIENIKSNGHADLRHTLNTLDLELPEGLARSNHGDQYREDLFFRYNQTLQYYFDGSARIDTSF